MFIQKRDDFKYINKTLEVVSTIEEINKLKVVSLIIFNYTQSIKECHQFFLFMISLQILVSLI